MKTVFITGATGFLGRACLPGLLALGYEVHALARRPLQAEFPDVSWHPLDLLDPQRTAELIGRIRPSHLLHLAWVTEHGAYWQSPENLRWVQATLELLQAFVRHGGRRAVLAGTCVEYDWQHGFCRENHTPLRSSSLYGVCKGALSQIAEAFASQQQISLAWTRYFFLYGPNEDPRRFVPAMIGSLLNHQTARCNHGAQIRDYLYSLDAAEATVRILDSDLRGPINLASGVPITLGGLAEAIAGLMGRPDLLEIGNVPAPDARMVLADTTRLTNELGWQPRHSVTDALKATIAWWRGQRAENQ